MNNGTAEIRSFHLKGPDTNIDLTGTAGLTGVRALNLKLDAKANASLASLFTEAVRARGPLEVRAAVTGAIDAPKANGFAQLTDAQLSVEEPKIGIDSLNARLEVSGDRVELRRLEGTINGGDLSGTGGFNFANGELRNTNLDIKATEVYLEYPADLRTVSNINLQLRNAAERLVLGGNVEITDGGLTKLDIESSILQAASAPRGLDLTEQRNPLLEKLRFDLAIKTANPLIIDTTLSEAEIDADLRLLGNPYQPGLSGRLSIGEGGILRLNEREYLIERGEITFANERRIEPSLDIEATTRAEGFDITLRITGEPGKTETTLTSDPPLPEPDILAVLLTGRRLDELRGNEGEVARNQVLSYLTGRVGGAIGSQIAGATGLSTVRIEPNLIAAETDPSARLTVGQDITRNLELIYSMDLVNSSDQIYVARYDISKRFSTRGVRQSDGSFRLDFRHDLRFGGEREPRRGDRRVQRIVDNVRIVGNTVFTDEQLAKKLKAKTGKRYDFFKTRKSVDKIQEMFADKNLLESSVRLRRETEANKVDLTLEVEAGPEVDIVWTGFEPPKKLRNRVREIWQSGVFDRQRADDAVVAIKESLAGERRLQPEITYDITEPADNKKRIEFKVTPGPVFHDVALAFEGASGIDENTLTEIVKSQKLGDDVYGRPGDVADLLEKYYRDQGYLDANVASTPRYELDKTTATGRVVFTVTEGPLYKIGAVEFKGNQVFDSSKLFATVPLAKGLPWRPALREHATQALRELYWNEGYNDAEPEIATRRNSETGTVDVSVTIAENRKSVVRELVIKGNAKTSDNLVRTQLAFAVGQPLDLSKVSESRRNLYNTGAYTTVEIAREEIENAPEEPGIRPVRVTVQLREVQPYQVRYGGSYDTERGPGVILDIENYNSLGSARTLGLRTRYDSQLREARLYFSQPLLRRFPVRTTITPYWRQERNPSTEQSDGFDVDRIGASFQQEARFRRFYVFNYGYRIERSVTTIRSEVPVPEVPLRIAGLTSALTRETRDDALDATRGSLFSSALQFSPKLLGSEVPFVKFFSQYFRYIPLEPPRTDIFTGKTERPRFVYAGAVRLGLARGLSGMEVPFSERFFAGGANTLRGFEQNTVGPIDFDVPQGGEAMFVINNEIRHPLFSIFDIAAFSDIGNVYRRIEDFSFSDIRKTAGLGLRVRTRWVLVRFDYGLKLDRREGERLGRFFFSIGQAW